MKLAKRLGLLAVPVLLISVFITMTAFADSTEKQQIILDYLNITSSDMNLNDKATRADMAKMFAATTIEGDISDFVDSSVVIGDVPSYSDDYAYIAYLYKIGLICGDSDGNFNPDSPVEAEHAAKLAAKLLGMIKPQNETYTQILGKSGISVASSAGGYMTKGNIANLIYDMLMHKTYDAVYSGNGITSTSLGDETYLEKVFAIYEINDIVSEDSYSSLYGKSNLRENQYKINDIIFNNKTGRNDLFAMNICGFYRYNRSDDYDLLCAYPSGNNVVSINSDRIENYKNKQYEYSKSEYDEKYYKANLANGFTAIYNGIFVSGADGFKDSDMIPKSGSVTLIDNNHDGKYDVALIKSYNNGIFNGYDENKNIIYTNNGNYEFDEDKLIITDIDGNSLKLSSIKDNSVLSIGQSFKKDSTIIVVSEKTVSGIIEQKGSDYVMIGDAMFYYDSSLESDMQLRSSGIFYINFEGKIVYADINNTDGWFYAYMVAAAEDTFDSIKFRVFTEDGKIVDYKVTGKLTIDGKRQKWTLDGAVNAIQNANGKFKGIVRCCMNSDGILTRIDTVNNVTSSNDDELISIRSASGSMSFRDNMLACRFIINDKTKIFVIPNEDDKDSYYVLSRKDMVSSKTYDVAGAYKTKADSFFAEAMVLTNSSLISASDREQHLSVVEDIWTTSNADGDKVNKLVISNDKQQKFEILTESENTLNDKTSGLTISKGDVIRFGYSNEGYIEDDNISLVYSHKNGWHLPSIDSTAMDNYMCVKVGYVYDVSDGYMQIQLTDPAVDDDESTARYYLSLSKAAVYTIDSRDNVSSASAKDLKSWVKNGESAVVAFHAEYGVVFCLYIYE